MKKVLIEKVRELMDILDSQHLVIPCSEFDEALVAMKELNPDVIVFTEKAFNLEPLEVCRAIREKYSLVVPIIVVLNFYSLLELSQLKVLGARTLVKPFSKEELNQLIYEVTTPPKVLPVVEKIALHKEELKEVVRQQVKSELKILMKQILEGIEKYA
ncbi:MAG: hypothetical protein NZ809_04995 [Thermodesulfovibrio sp.]|nr:hypothetical protein [Thermodesulfovibrio sp.]